MRRASKVDANQARIVQALRKLGVAVEIIGLPLDLLICHRGETSLMEIKDEDGRLTKSQVDFIARWPGKIHICRTEEEAINAALNVKKEIAN